MSEKAADPQAENAWIVWMLDAPEAAQVALDLALEGLGQDPENPGFAWAKGAFGADGVPPKVTAEVVPGVSWEEVIDVGGSLENTGKRRYIRLDEDEVIELVRVPAGTFFVGAPQVAGYPDNAMNPLRQVTLERDVFVGRFLVTNGQYRCFTKSMRHPTPVYAGTGHLNGLRQPVVGVSMRDTEAFCGWVAQKSGYRVRLPMAVEWERAARGEDGRPYPWGNEKPVQDEARTGYRYRSSTPEVGTQPQRTSPYGVEDLVGSTQQICRVVDPPWEGYGQLRDSALCGSYAPLASRHYAWLVQPWSGLPSRHVGFRILCEI